MEALSYYYRITIVTVHARAAGNTAHRFAVRRTHTHKMHLTLLKLRILFAFCQWILSVVFGLLSHYMRDSQFLYFPSFFSHCCPFYVVYLQLEIYDRHRWHVVHLRINIGYIWACGEQRSARARTHSFIRPCNGDARRPTTTHGCAVRGVLCVFIPHNQLQ